MRRVLQKGIVVNRNLVIMVRFANVNRTMTNNISSVLCNDYMCNMKRKSTLVDSVSAEPKVSAVGRKQLSLTVIPQNKANRLRNVSSEPVYAAPLARRSQSPARRSQSPARRRATFNFSLLTAFAVLLCLFFGGTAWGQITLLSENFDNMSSISTSYSATNWYAYNAGSGNNWELSSDEANSGSYSASYRYDSDYGANCYLVSPPFSVTANMTSLNISLYEMTWDYNGYYPEKFEVFFVKANDFSTAGGVVSATHYSAIASASYTDHSFTQVSGSSTNSALAGQSVRAVIHCTSDADMNALFIDDIIVAEVSSNMGDMCAITIELTDAYGDGGGSMQVINSSTSVVLGSYTLGDGLSATYTLNVFDGTPLSFVYASTDRWPYENGYVILDPNGDEVARHDGCGDSDDCDAPNNGEVATYTVNCSACPNPTNLAVNGITTSSATISWTPNGGQVQFSTDGTNWEDMNTSSKTLTGLTAATNYTVYVRTDCGGGDYSGGVSVQFTTLLCNPEDMCAISYSLTDSNSDGWDGNAHMDVVDATTGELLATIRLASGGSSTGSFDVCNGRSIVFQWVAGTYDGECGYTITDVNGDPIFSGSGAMSSDENYIVNCSACPNPTGITTTVTVNTATISWTPNGGTVQFSTDGTNWESVNTNTKELTNLDAATSYTVYLRTDCGGGEYSSGVNVSFTTYCNTISLPFIETFDSDSPTRNCWTIVDVDNDAYYDYGIYAGTWNFYEGSAEYFYQYDENYNADNPGNDWLISPKIAVVDGAYLTFEYKAGSTSWTEKFEVYVMNSPDGYGSATKISGPDPITANQTNYLTIDPIDLSSYADQDICIGIKCVSDADMLSLQIDNFTIMAPPSGNHIPTDMTWAQFCIYENTCYPHGYDTFYLDEDITVTQMAGTESCPFSGTFDGQGNKITVGISSSEQGAAPFRYISGATIQNLVVDGTVTSTAHHASGLVGFCADGSTNTIQNCHISTDISNSNAYNGDSGNNYMGGLVGHNKSATTSIIGCVYDGTLTSQGFKGGIIGFADNGYSPNTVNITIKDCYFGGGYSANGYSNPNFSPVAARSAHDFIMNLTSSNFYYNTDAGTFTSTGYSYEGNNNNSNDPGYISPKHAYSVTGATDVTVEMGGSPTNTYSVSGITAYATGIVYDGNIYGGDGDELALSLGYICALSGYSADNGTLSGSATTGTNDAYTLTMAANNTTISVSAEITVSANPSAGGSVSGGGTFPAGASQTVTATANTGYHFDKWTESGLAVSSDASYTFTVSCAGDLVANFAPNVYNITYMDEGNEAFSGVHGSGYPTQHIYGSVTVLVSPTKTGYTFDGWFTSSDCTGSSVTSLGATDYTADITLYAKWTINTYTVTTTVYPSEGGTATGGGSYDYGTTATISATANTGYQFVNWTASNGNVVSHDASYSFTVTGNVTYQANFTSTTPLSLPWSENFDSYSGPTPQLLPGEWATPLRNEQKPCVHNYDYGAASDPWCLEMRGSEASMVVLPQFNRPLNKLTVAFKCARGTTTGPAKLGYVTDPSDASTFVELATMSEPIHLSGSNPQPTSYSFDLTTIANAPDNSDYRLAIRATNIAESFYFDDFWVIEFSAESASVDNSYCIDDGATTLSVNVSGSGSYHYQWYKDGSSISGATGSSYTPLTETDGTNTYTVSVTDRNCGNTANVTIAQITVNTPSPDVSGTYDYIWRGLSADWNTASNWYMYSEGNYTVASTMPTEAKDYYIGTGSSCIEPSYWPSFIDDVEVNNITIASGSNDITIGEGKTLTIDGAATFSGGIIKGNVEFGASGSTTGASLTSYVDGIVTKNGNGSSFTFPTGSDGVLGTITATIASGESAVAKFNHKSSGFDQEHDGYPRWWNVADMCGAEPFNHVSNFEYWDFNSTADLSGVTFVSKASSADAHFHNPSEYPADDSDIIQIAVYDGCWKNIGGHLDMSDENKTITISGVNASRGTTRSGSAITTFGSKDPSVVLPIELTSFTATCDGRSALVEWTTATEKNNDYFSLERSDDAINFTEVARVAGAGNSIEPIDYTYNDYGIHGGDNYYRLVQVDYDGTRTVSEVIVANCIEPESDGEPEVLAYPNPFSSELTVVLDNFGNRAATIEVYDMLGKLIYTNKISAPQNSYETILNLSNLPPAAYTVRVSTNDFVINRNVVKN